ncbi:MAG: universal stress protein [Alphaproteobacteria bacterium]|nr:universal stress protein [Alphaproteobacteria bacterium]
MSRIIAFIDASIYADSVCDHAAWLAKRMSVGIDLIHVLGRRDMTNTQGNLSGALDLDARDHLLAELSSIDEQNAKLAQKKGRVILDHAKKRLEDAGVADVQLKLRIGDLIDTMHEFEGQSSLIVIGKRGEAADFAKLHLGSNVERVARASEKPVLVTSRAFQPIKRVLVAFDGGASVTKAVTYLSKTHKAFSGLDLHLLMVGDRTTDATDRIEHAAGILNAAGYDVKSEIVPGEPDKVIAKAVENDDFDLMLMGAYGHSRIRNLIIGSTTTEMIRSCKIPIVLFR